MTYSHNDLIQLLRNIDRGGYSQIPDSLEKKIDPKLILNDDYGIKDRWEIVKNSFQKGQLGNVVDLGGNNGFFCLSALECGIASHAVVYDIEPKFLEVGRAMAKEMKINSIDFVEQKINLDFIKQIKDVDSVFCFNLLHWAGKYFDNEFVKQIGWEEYALKFFKELRNKSDHLVFSLGLKKNTPIYWDISSNKRPTRLLNILNESGWRVKYSANVEDIRLFGADFANNLRAKPYVNTLLNSSYKLKRGFAKLLKKKSKSGMRASYYFCICD